MQKYYLSIIERTILKRFGQEKKKRKLSPKILDFKDGKYKADGEPFSSTVVPVSGQLPILEFLPCEHRHDLEIFLTHPSKKP